MRPRIHGTGFCRRSLQIARNRGIPKLHCWWSHLLRGFNPLKLEILLSWESARLSPTKRTSRSSSSSICRSSHLRTTTRSIRVRIAPLFAHVVLLLFLHFWTHTPRPDHAAALLPNPDHRNQGSLGTYRNSASLRGRLSGEAGLDQDDGASMACGWLRCVFLVDLQRPFLVCCCRVDGVRWSASPQHSFIRLPTGLASPQHSDARH